MKCLICKDKEEARNISFCKDCWVGFRASKEEQERLFPSIDYVRKDNHKDVYRHTPTLSEICIDVRMSLNGACDPWSKEELVATKSMLENRVKYWYPSNKHDLEFDNCVLALIKVTCSMITHHLETINV